MADSVEFLFLDYNFAPPFFITQLNPIINQIFDNIKMSIFRCFVKSSKISIIFCFNSGFSFNFLSSALFFYPRILSKSVQYDIFDFDFDIDDFLKEVRSKLEMTIEQLAGGCMNSTGLCDAVSIIKRIECSK